MKRIRQETLSTRPVNAVNIHSTYHVRLATSTTTAEEEKEHVRASLLYARRSTKLGHPWTDFPLQPIRMTETVPLHRYNRMKKYLSSDSYTMEWAFY